MQSRKLGCKLGLVASRTIVVVLLLALPLVWLFTQESSGIEEVQTARETGSEQQAQPSIDSGPSRLPAEINGVVPSSEAPSGPTLGDPVLSKSPVGPSAADENRVELQWYRSNDLGMALELLEFSDTPSSLERGEITQQVGGAEQSAISDGSLPPSLVQSGIPWILQIQRSAQQQSKTLFFRGQPRENWLLIYRNSLLFQQQHRRHTILIENQFYDEENGRLSEISHYAEDTGSLLDRQLFFYTEAGNLSYKMSYNQEGQLECKTNYHLDITGQLVKLNIQMYLKSRSLVQYQLPSFDTFVQNNSNSKKYLINLFDKNQRNIRRILYQNNTITKRTNFEYGSNAKLKRSIVTEKDQVTQYDYNTEGAVLQRQVWQNSVLSETEIYAYDELGRLRNKKNSLRAENEFFEERYSYTASSNDLEKVEYFRNDEIDKIRNYTGIYSYYEELYFNNIPVAKIYYSYGDRLETKVTFKNVPVAEGADEVFNGREHTAQGKDVAGTER